MKSGSRILLVTSWYPHEGHALEGVFVREFAQLLSKEFEILVFHPLFKEHLSVPFRHLKNQNQGFQEHTLEIKYKKGIPWFFSNRKNYHQALLDALKNHIVPFRPEIIHSQIIWQAGLAASIIQKKLQIPLAHLEHYSGLLPQDGTIRGYRMLLCKKWLKNAQAHAVVSPALGNLISHWTGKNVMNIYNVLDPLFFETPILPLAEKKPYKFLHVSSFDYRMKQTDKIISTFLSFNKNYPDTELIMVGPQSKLSAYSELTKEKITLIPSGMSKKELIALMQKCAVNICFSAYETFAVTVAETLCLGIPNIYTSCGGPEYYIESDMGWEANPRDNKSLYLAMEKAYFKNGISSSESIAQRTREKMNRDKILFSFNQLFDQACAVLQA